MAESGERAKKGGTGAHRGEQKSRLLFQGSPISASQNSQSSRWQKLAKMKPTDFEKKQAGLPKQF